MADISKIRLGDQSGTYTEYNIKDAAARQATNDLDERVDEIEGNIDVKVQPSGGTFYRYGVPTTDNWCSKFVSKDIAGIVVETADEARKFNLRNPATSGICIASGAGQRWNIVAPNGYRIKTYKIVATLRDGQPEGVVFLTPQGGDPFQILPNSDITIEVSINDASTYFLTEDVSTEPLDRQIWFKTFEVHVERTSSLATMDDVNRKQDIISDLTTIRNGAAKGATSLQPTAQTLSDAQKAQARENIGAAALAEFDDYAKKDDLESGDVVPALASDLLSWSQRSLTPNTESAMSDIKVRTTAGDASIATSVPAYFQKIVPTSHMFNGTNFRASGFNLLRLTSDNGVATKGSGDWWYIPVPKLTFVGYGAHGDNNGIILTAAGGTNINNATVYFKPFASGLPTSATDGTAATYTDAQGVRFYTTPSAGWLIISGITWASTCAHLAWSITADYNKYVSPTDANDGGTIIDLTGVGSGIGVLYRVFTVADSVERTGDTSMLKTVRVGYSNSLTWTTTQDTVEQGATQTYTHTATISGMKSGGEVAVVIGTTEQVVVMSGTSISVQDTNDATAWNALTKDVYYQLAAETTSTITINTLVPVNDMGIEVLDATAGTATVTMLYAQGIQDTVAYIVSEWKPGIQDEVALLSEEIGDLTAALYNEMAKDPDMKYGQPRILWGNGTPQESIVPTNWRQFLDGGYNWIGKPAFVGQVYINTAVTSGGYYIGYKKSDYTLDWRTIVA